jgi:hypothetical protein
MTLYRSGYRPARLPARFEVTPIIIAGDGQAAEVMRRKCVPDEWGDPIDAVAFWDDDSGELKAITCDYPNGQRAEVRIKRRGFTTSLTKTPTEQVPA